MGNSDSSPSLTTVETSGTLTSPPPLPTLTFDLIAEILCRLPVKQLMQLRCLCKTLNSLISDPKFTKKHLRMSNTRHHLIVSARNDSDELLLFDYRISSLLSTSTVTQTQLTLPIPITLPKYFSIVVTSAAMCSCDGILCINPCFNDLSVILWNPSIRKFKLLPPLAKTVPDSLGYDSLCSFGYDHFIDNYKVIAVSQCKNRKSEVSVLTLGTYHWRKIHDFPFGGIIIGSGIFVSGTVNWLAFDDLFRYAIVSLDLKNESYQIISQPDLEPGVRRLGVLRDCLCISVSSDKCLDVWVMKEYGNKETWTKLYTVPCHFQPTTLHIFEEDRVLLEFFEHGRESNKLKFCVYNSKKGTLNSQEIQNDGRAVNRSVYIESLISP